jgi:hypothetical protein
MARRIQNSAINPAASYTTQQFLDLPTNLSEQEKELVLQRIYHLQRTENSAHIGQQVKATGEEFLHAINAVRRVLELVKNQPVFVAIPGMPAVWLDKPTKSLPKSRSKAPLHPACLRSGFTQKSSTEALRLSEGSRFTAASNARKDPFGSQQRTALSPHVSRNVLDPNTEYVASEFVPPCNSELLAVAVAMVLIVPLRRASAARCGVFEIEAGDAEHEAAINDAERLVQLVRSQLALMQASAHPPIDMSAPIQRFLSSLLRSSP